MTKLKVNLEELEEDKEKNFQDRLKFIDLLVEHIKSTPDEQWSREQVAVINKNKRK
ncbi:MAG: hypothetical protein HY512_04015 [Candidatus Aenigmarchaeota archaeon]|nr:hypothetical protein [Candidatus Aenigmarchaeota archaeon]